MQVELHAEAEEELTEALGWYLARSWETARRFHDDYVHAEELVATGPLRWPELEPGVRRLNLRRFPYSLIYVVDPHRIVVLAVMHQRRRPGYWHTRLGR